ncbi:MAG: carboxylating nicotinate-nucleotide diphosphorylase [Cyanobacteria bacterium P01_H01_bin.74]
MTTVLPPLSIADEQILQTALFEDLAYGDITTDNLPQLYNAKSQASIITRQAGVVSGLSIATRLTAMVDRDLVFKPACCDGQFVQAGSVLATLSGSIVSVLKLERTLLNFLQHLSGIATRTREFVDLVKHTKAKIAHTRKTTPGLRILEQRAVIDGGGVAHRFNLASAVMVKDNHLQALAEQNQTQSPILLAVKTLRSRITHTTKIEVEVEYLSQVEQALQAGCDIILLDNMSPEQVTEAVQLIDGKAITEASGCIDLQTVAQYAETGVDILSTSKITFAVASLDIGLDIDTTA